MICTQSGWSGGTVRGGQCDQTGSEKTEIKEQNCLTLMKRRLKKDNETACKWHVDYLHIHKWHNISCLHIKQHWTYLHIIYPHFIILQSINLKCIIIFTLCLTLR